MTTTTKVMAVVVGCVGLLLGGCKGDKPKEAPAVNPADPSGKPADPAVAQAAAGAPIAAAGAAPEAAGEPGAQAAAGGAAAAVAASPTICCCESSGDATHFTLEKDHAACGRDDMRGSCVELSECEVSGNPQLLEAGKPITANWDDEGLFKGPVVWSPAEHHHVALEVKYEMGADHITLRARAGEKWRDLGKMQVNPARGGTMTFTLEKDGVVTFASAMETGEMEPEVTAWRLRYDADAEKVTVKKK